LLVAASADLQPEPALDGRHRARPGNVPDHLVADRRQTCPVRSRAGDVERVDPHVLRGDLQHRDSLVVRRGPVAHRPLRPGLVRPWAAGVDPGGVVQEGVPLEVPGACAARSRREESEERLRVPELHGKVEAGRQQGLPDLGQGSPYLRGGERFLCGDRGQDDGGSADREVGGRAPGEQVPRLADPAGRHRARRHGRRRGAGAGADAVDRDAPEDGRRAEEPQGEQGHETDQELSAVPGPGQPGALAAGQRLGGVHAGHPARQVDGLAAGGDGGANGVGRRGGGFLGGHQASRGCGGGGG
jgi:hypothetical protein